MGNTNILEQIAEVLENRKRETTDKSYVASLYAQGSQVIEGKILEEAQEVVDASGAQEAELVHEISDLWFHCQVLLAYRGIDVRSVFSELEKRFGVSGHEEKKRRKNSEEAVCQ